MDRRELYEHNTDLAIEVERTLGSDRVRELLNSVVAEVLTSVRAYDKHEQIYIVATVAATIIFEGGGIE